MDDLPELDAYDLSVLSQAVNSNGEAAYTFSGLAEVLGLSVAENTEPAAARMWGNDGRR